MHDLLLLFILNFGNSTCMDCQMCTNISKSPQIHHEIDGSKESDGEDQEMNNYLYNPLRCDYGFCSFKTIVFATKHDL